MRAHDQFNTTIYSLNDRYRGIKKSRKVIFVHPDDLAMLGVKDGDIVDVHSEFTDNVDRVIRNFKVVGFPTSRGCAATYFPEGNPLVPLGFTADGSNTPASKSVVIRFEPPALPEGDLADLVTGAKVSA
jgi:formate dehydrogenase major subunit